MLVLQYEAHNAEQTRACGSNLLFQCPSGYLRPSKIYIHMHIHLILSKCCFKCLACTSAFAVCCLVNYRSEHHGLLSLQVDALCTRPIRGGHVCAYVTVLHCPCILNKSESSARRIMDSGQEAVQRVRRVLEQVQEPFKFLLISFKLPAHITAHSI